MKNFFRALVDLFVGLLVLIVLAVSAVCLFPVTVICAILGLFYFVGTRIGWIDPKEYEKEIGVEEPVTTKEPVADNSDVFIDVEDFPVTDNSDVFINVEDFVPATDNASVAPTPQSTPTPEPMETSTTPEPVTESTVDPSSTTLGPHNY
jgi:hypothetical protein